jgi:hypothetical protein
MCPWPNMLEGNALKYTSRGYVKIKLEATEMGDLQPVGSTESIPRACVTLTITDTGKGISSDFIRSKLFTPFAQENSLSSGTGLGLSIVRSIVALLEGEIAIKSELGRGTGVLFPSSTSNFRPGTTYRSHYSPVKHKLTLNIRSQSYSPLTTGIAESRIFWEHAKVCCIGAEGIGRGDRPIEAASHWENCLLTWLQP